MLPHLVQAFGRALRHRVPVLYRHFCMQVMLDSSLEAKFLDMAFAALTEGIGLGVRDERSRDFRCSCQADSTDSLRVISMRSVLAFCSRCPLQETGAHHEAFRSARQDVAAIQREPL